MSTREMICSLVSNNVESSDLDLLYNLILKFVPADEPFLDEIAAIAETDNETQFISFDNVNWN